MKELFLNLTFVGFWFPMFLGAKGWLLWLVIIVITLNWPERKGSVKTEDS